MDILVKIGHDDIFDNDVEKMGFLAATLEMELRAVLTTRGQEVVAVDAELIGIMRNNGETTILNFKVGEGGDTQVLPSYLAFLGSVDEV